MPPPKTKYDPYVVGEKDWVPVTWTEIPKGKSGLDRVTVTEWGQLEYDKGFKAGGESRASLAIRVVMDKAKKKFEDGYDGEANALRVLAQEIKRICEAIP